MIVNNICKIIIEFYNKLTIENNISFSKILAGLIIWNIMIYIITKIISTINKKKYF